VLRKNAAEFVGIQEVQNMLEQLEQAFPALVKEVVPKAVSPFQLTDILRRLVEEEISIRDLRSILQALAEPFQLGAERVFVSASLGVTLCPDDGTDAGVLLKHADQAMYSAKALGRNRCSYFTLSMQEAAQARKRLVSDLRMAFEQDQFRVVYQPIIDLRSGQICKAEALVRWQHPDRGLVNPADFISVTEQTGIILSLGDWVFRQAANQVVLWLERFGPDFQINVNVSPAQFQNDGINHDAWFYYLEQRNLTGRNIGVEITEGLLMDTNPSVTDLLFKFRDSGMQVALDDFGTGYSSLAYLKKFDIDYIKIDRVFVQNLAPGSDDLVLCEAMTVMAHKLGIKVVAEGVETAQQRDLLVSIGCDYAQGYLFSEPVSAEEFENLRIESAVIAPASSGSGLAPLCL
jgi:EAL domain-containing protein (putative c-di-GMP-specific phosphodiesterase class I)